MPRLSTLELPPIDLGDQTPGQRIAHLRKQRGLTQVELAEQMGLTQGLLSAYERGRLRIHAEMVARFALALGVTTDELIGLKVNGRKKQEPQLSLRLIRRMQKIEALPPSKQKALLQTIDSFLKGAAKD